MTYRIIFLPEAKDDLREIRYFIRKESSPAIAKRYTIALADRCEELKLFPHQGTPRDGSPEGLRVIGFRGRVSIHFRVVGKTVRILGFTYAGSNWQAQSQ